MSTVSTASKKKKILPRPEKRRTLQQAMVVTNKRYAGTLAKLAK